MQRETENRNHYETQRHHQNRHLGAHRSTHCPWSRHGTHVLQRCSHHHEQVRILSARRHLGHDSDQDHRVLRCFEKVSRKGHATKKKALSIVPDSIARQKYPEKYLIPKPLWGMCLKGGEWLPPVQKK